MPEQPMDFLSFQDPDLKLSLLMMQYRDESLMMSELGAGSWSSLAHLLARAGYRDDVGMAPTAETVQLLWRAVQGQRFRPEVAASLAFFAEAA